MKTCTCVGRLANTNQYSTMDDIDSYQNLSLDHYETCSPPHLAHSSWEGSLEAGDRPSDLAQNSEASLQFLPLVRWNDGVAHVDNPQSYIHYSVEWKLSLNGRVTAKDTKQHVLLSPIDF
ncbi:hypothetical protein F4824DRAFT_439702 [Ustulina deusta]|nr:hypothetical protein F4824DRAFT_439702 [Ustulina deusta]